MDRSDSSVGAVRLRGARRTRAVTGTAPWWGAAIAVVMSAVTGCAAASSASPSTVTVTATVTSVSMSTVTVAAEPDTGAADTADGALTSTATAPDPCSLISQDEADALAGTPLDPPTAAPESCTFYGPPTGPLGQVEVYVGDGAKKFLDVERDLGHELRPLEGVGDEAYAGEATTFVRSDFLWVAIRLVRLNDPAENAGPLEAITRAVANRIG